MANVTKPVILDETGQSIASAISTMSATSVGNLSALTTTDKTSLVGAVNEVRSGLTNMITRVSTDNTVAVGATDTIALPSGTDSTKVAILSCFLVVGSALYYDSAEVTTVYNGAITVKNTGGAAGYICIDYSVIN